MNLDYNDINFLTLPHMIFEFPFQKRATIRTQEYFYHQISNTPFSLGIALPRDYGRYRVNGKTEVLLETQKGLNGETNCFIIYS